MNAHGFVEAIVKLRETCHTQTSSNSVGVGKTTPTQTLAPKGGAAYSLCTCVCFFVHTKLCFIRPIQAKSNTQACVCAHIVCLCVCVYVCNNLAQNGQVCATYFDMGKTWPSCLHRDWLKDWPCRKLHRWQWAKAAQAHKHTHRHTSTRIHTSCAQRRQQQRLLAAVPHCRWC